MKKYLLGLFSVSTLVLWLMLGIAAPTFATHITCIRAQFLPSLQSDHPPDPTPRFDADLKACAPGYVADGAVNVRHPTGTIAGVTLAWDLEEAGCSPQALGGGATTIITVNVEATSEKLCWTLLIAVRCSSVFLEPETRKGSASWQFTILEEEPPAPSQPPPAPPPTQGTGINIQNFAFNPETVTISVGTTLTWINLDSAPHTVTSDDNLFDSGNLNQNATFSHTFTTPGTFTYHCSIHPSMTAKVVVQGTQSPPPPPPPIGGATDLEAFDTNSNNLIDDPEFFAVIDAWIAGQLDDAAFFQAVDLWVSQAPISSAGLPATSLRLGVVTLAMNSASRTITFSASGQGISTMYVQIFNLNGQKIFSQEVVGQRLKWNLTTRSGQSVANGVYLYVLTVHGIHGTELRSKTQKLIVLR